MKVLKDSRVLPYAKELRSKMTPQENKLWYRFLRGYPVKFYKQRIISSYIADFYCASAKLVVELDGDQHYSDEAMRYDAARTMLFEDCGIQVLRFQNREVDLQFAAVCDRIDRAVQERSRQSKQ